MQPLQDRCLLNIPTVIDCLHSKFDVYGASPRFLSDWRWYKQIVGIQRGFNEKALDDYYTNNLKLLDYRFEFPVHTLKFGYQLEEICSRSWDLMCLIENGDQSSWKGIFTTLEELCAHIEIAAPITTDAIREIARCLQGDDVDMPLPCFSTWWGRGQQYISLIRNISEEVIS